MKARFAENPNYVRSESLLKDLHRLIAEGKGDSDEADTLRDAMDIPWRTLSREEIDRLNGLSSDLYMLQNDEMYEQYDSSEWTEDRLRYEIGTALKRRTQQDWERLLALLRKGPTFMPQDQIAWLRSSAYRALGHSDTALRFLDYAASLNPGKAEYRWMMMAL